MSWMFPIVWFFLFGIGIYIMMKFIFIPWSRDLDERYADLEVRRKALQKRNAELKER